MTVLDVDPKLQNLASNIVARAMIVLVGVLGLPCTAFSQDKPALIVQSGHTAEVNSVAFSPDGRYALSGSYDQTLKLWEVETGEEVRTFKGHSAPVYSVAFSPDSRYVLSGSSDGTTRLWEVDSGDELALLMTIGEKDWFVTAPDGRFDGTTEGMKALHYVQGMKVVPLDSLFEQFYTPNLLGQFLSAETAPLK